VPEASGAEDSRRMYGDLAGLWPMITLPEDYVAESDEFARVINELLR